MTHPLCTSAQTWKRQPHYFWVSHQGISDMPYISLHQSIRAGFGHVLQPFHCLTAYFPFDRVTQIWVTVWIRLTDVCQTQMFYFGDGTSRNRGLLQNFYRNVFASQIMLTILYNVFGNSPRTVPSYISTRETSEKMTVSHVAKWSHNSFRNMSEAQLTQHFFGRRSQKEAKSGTDNRNNASQVFQKCWKHWRRLQMRFQPKHFLN